MVLAILISGIFIFSLVEYLIHAKLFHAKPGSIFKTFVLGHIAHHKDPQGYDSLPFFFASVLLLIFALAVSVAVVIVGLWSSEFLMRIMGAEGAYLQSALDYVDLIILGSVFVITGMFVNSLLNAQGDMELRRLREVQVEADRVLEALDAAMQADANTLLDNIEKERLLEARQRLLFARQQDNHDVITNAMKVLEKTAEFYVERRMNLSIKTAMSGHNVDEF